MEILGASASNPVPWMIASSNCPQCGHPLPPGEPAAGSACPACGLILAKYGMARARPRRPGPSRPAGEAESFWVRWLFPVPRQVAQGTWLARTLTLIVFFVWTIIIWRNANIPAGEVGSPFLHTLLLPFHEAGHYVLFRWFGHFIMTLGGTLGQHLLPLILSLALLYKRRDPFGAALFLWLLGFSILDMAVYMYDAYDPRILLLGGATGAESDSHDWINLFSELGLIQKAQTIGSFFDWLGRTVMFLGLVWAGVVLWLQKTRLSDSPRAEIDRGA